MGVPMDDLSAYIFSHYERLLTAAEREAHFSMGLFGVGGSFGSEPQSLASMSASDEVRGLASLGNIGFRQRVVERILRDHADEVVLNRCSKCSGLCRSPRARQCFRCGHSWHEQPKA